MRQKFNGLKFDSDGQTSCAEEVVCMSRVFPRKYNTYSHEKRTYLEISNFLGLHTGIKLHVKFLSKHYKHFIVFTVAVPKAAV
jgi:hypothetical protein